MLVYPGICLFLSPFVESEKSKYIKTSRTKLNHHGNCHSESSSVSSLELRALAESKLLVVIFILYDLNIEQFLTENLPWNL